MSESDTEVEVPKNTEHLLVETIRQVGVSNYSLISRLTGLNPETVRYKVNKQLANIGLNVQINVDYSQLGFSLGLLTVKAHSSHGKSWLDQCSYLSYVGKLMAGDRYICIYTVPHRFKKKYLDMLATQQQAGLIEEFDSQEVSWVRYPPLRAEYFDFSAGNWKVDWQRIDFMQKEVGITSSFPANTDPKVDYVDVRILRAMQEDPTINPAKIAKEMNANARTVRYHYSEHVLKNRFILGNNLRWVKPLVEGKQGDLMQVAFAFKNLEQKDMEFARKLCNRIPFTWLEAGTVNRSYYAFLDIPVINFHYTIGNIEAHAEPLRDKFEMIMLDPGRSHSLNLPEEMFDEERGWRLITPQEAHQMVGHSPKSSEEGTRTSE